MQSRPTTRNYATKYKQIGFCLVLLPHSNLEIVTERRNASIAQDRSPRYSYPVYPDKSCERLISTRN